MKGHVLITGGSGTFGLAMTKRLLAMREAPDKITILSRDEVKQSHMREEFHHDHRLRFTLGDVRDPQRLSEVLPGVDFVFHAAALKRIEACAYDPQEAVRTNVIGSLNLMRAAIPAGVKKVIALSSDKAAAPSTTYGATKLCMEALFTSSTKQTDRVGHGTACAVVRYGNVAGSRGSVIQLWRRGGEGLALFDTEATRFWFTIGGAVDLALWALNVATGGELYVPGLPAFRVLDLALAMGLDPDKMVRPMARPGEKRHEVMISPDEAALFRTRRREDGQVIYMKTPVSPSTWSALPPGFVLSSETAHRMSVEDLREALRAVD